MWQAAVSRRMAAFRSTSSNNNNTMTITGTITQRGRVVQSIFRRRGSDLVATNRQRWRIVPEQQQQWTTAAMATGMFPPTDLRQLQQQQQPQPQPPSHASEEQRPVTKETLHLWETLMVSQQFNVNYSYLPPTTQEATKQNDWVQYFDQLGNSSVVAIDNANVEEEEEEEQDINDDDQEELVGELDENKNVSMSAQAEKTETEKTVHVVAPETTAQPPPPTSLTSPLPPSDQDRFEAVGSFHRSIASWMSRSRPHTAFQVFQRAQRKGYAKDLPLPMIRRLFFDLANGNHPIEAAKLLAFYRQVTACQCDGDPTGYVDELACLCYSFRHLDPQKNRKPKIEHLVRTTLHELQKLDRAGQERCFPLMVSSLTSQRTVQIGRLARPVYNYMIEQNFEVPPGYWEHLLGNSKYNRKADLPYEQVLEKCIQAGRYPHPECVLHALANLYPYHDATATIRMLKCVLKLQQTPVEQFQQYTFQGADYRVNLSTLELIGAAAASKGYYDMNLVIWDMMDVMGYEPTEFVYENTILAFLARPTTYANAFACLADMEENGFVPTRALVRSMSSYLRLASKNLHVANGVLKDMRQEGRPPSVAAFNAVLSGAAERGDVDRALSMMDEFACNNLEPNSDSYSFALETFGKTLSRRRVNPASETLTASCLDLADSILSTIEEKGISLTQHIVRAYVELLCIAQETETATNVVRQSHTRGLVNNKILYRVAVANLERGNLDVAREMLGNANPPIPGLARKIRQYELLGTNVVAEEGREESRTDNKLHYADAEALVDPVDTTNDEGKMKPDDTTSPT